MRSNTACWCKDCKRYHEEHCVNGKSDWVTEPRGEYDSCKDCVLKED